MPVETGGAGPAPTPSASGGANDGGSGGSAGSSATSGGAGAANAGGGGAAVDGGAPGGGAAGSGEQPYDPCPPAGDPCRIVPFGDSITDGYIIPGGYRMELFHLALSAGQNIEFFGSGMNGPTTVDGVAFPRSHEGHSGYTIDDAPQAGRSGISPLVDTVLGFDPDIILLKIGTNDLDQNVDVQNAPVRLGNLLDDIFSKDDHVLVVVAQIIPSRDTALNDRVAAYNAAIPGLVAERKAQGKHALVADAESAFLADPNYQSSLLADTLHPNETGYALLAQTWYDVISDLLH